MVDVVSAEVRSRMMAGIRGRNTQPERLLRRELHACGFRFRLHRKELPGSPDLVFPRYHAALFVHGCFWHRHAGCRYASTPATRADFWQRKFDTNVARDKRVQDDLTALGWRVAVVWECALRKGVKETGERVSDWLKIDPGVESFLRCDIGSR
jgi:DNA mismatch endonuclease (patch repair protein)